MAEQKDPSERDPGPKRGKKKGPLGLSPIIWVVAGAVVLYLYYTNKNKAKPSTNSQGLVNPGAVPLVASKTAPSTNSEWAVLAEQEGISLGGDPVLVEQAISDFLESVPLSPSEQAIIDGIIQQIGPPPEFVATSVQPTSSSSGQCASGYVWDDVTQACVLSTTGTGTGGTGTGGTGTGGTGTGGTGTSTPTNIINGLPTTNTVSLQPSQGVTLAQGATINSNPNTNGGGFSSNGITYSEAGAANQASPSTYGATAGQTATNINGVPVVSATATAAQQAANQASEAAKWNAEVLKLPGGQSFTAPQSANISHTVSTPYTPSQPVLQSGTGGQTSVGTTSGVPYGTVGVPTSSGVVQGSYVSSIPAGAENGGTLSAPNVTPGQIIFANGKYYTGV